MYCFKRRDRTSLVISYDSVEHKNRQEAKGASQLFVGHDGRTLFPLPSTHIFLPVLSLPTTPARVATRKLASLLLEEAEGVEADDREEV
jgi:hypothetical protein